MKSFEAVLIAEGDRLTPGLGIEAKGNKVILETVFGKRYTLAREKILFREPMSAETRADGLRWLKDRVGQAEALKDEVDVELLYESLADQEDAAHTLHHLARTYFSGAVDLLHLKAMDLAVGDGGDYFKRTGWKFRLQSRATLEQTRRKRAEAEEKARRLDVVLGRVATYLQDGLPEGGLEADEEAGAVMNQIRSFVVQGSGPGEVAVDRLKHVPAVSGRGGTLQETGLGLLLALGVCERPTDLLLGRYRLNRRFEAAHLEAVEAVKEAILDRRDLPTAGVEAWTIDDEGTEDYDDAVSLRPVEGGLELGVHIADPSPYIPSGSPLDEEAYTRGTTVYLPDRKYPMFPPELSEGLLSLRTGVERPVMSFYFPVDTPDAEPGEPRIVKECLTVSGNLTYDEVDQWLSGSGEAGRGEEALRTAYRIAEVMAASRLEAGAVTFHRPELKIYVDAEGEVHLRRIDSGTPARRLVSELMILVNRAGARYLERHDIPAIYRAQNPPREPVVLGATYDPVAFRREVRKMVKARLTLDPEPHAGLGLPCYTQLSSPLRRYADLVMHRQLSHAIDGRPVPFSDRDALLEVVVTSDMNYQTAVDLERKSKHAHGLRFLEGRVGEAFEMVVVDRLQHRSDVVAEFNDFGITGRIACMAGATPEVGAGLRAVIRSIDVIREEVILEPES